jgi:glutaminase
MTRLALTLAALVAAAGCASAEKPKPSEARPPSGAVAKTEKEVTVFAGAESASKAGAPPAADVIKAALSEAHARYQVLSEGKNADYIPQLAKVDPKLFGIAVATVDGQIFLEGDAATPFAIESISKVFVLALVMEKLGSEAVLDKVGADATGLPFNSITAIELHDARTVNPLVNAGAMATTGLAPGGTPEEKWGTIRAGLGRFAGHELPLDDAVYASEAKTNQRNQAIAKLLESYERFYAEPAATVDIYTRQCSLAVTAKDLAIMGATLANGGVNPVTKERIMDPANVPEVLAIMATAGLYDTSGTWLYKVGLPAKSGVGGGIIAIVPGRFAIAAFSPPLDAAGNSVRAQRAIEHIAHRLGVNLFASTPAAGKK